MLSVRDRDQADLIRGEPQRERTGVVFDKDPEEAFQRTEERPVDHVRLVLLTIGTDVVEVKAFRQVEVELNGGGLPFTTESVLDLQVDLGTVVHSV